MDEKGIMGFFRPLYQGLWAAEFHVNPRIQSRVGFYDIGGAPCPTTVEPKKTQNRETLKRSVTRRGFCCGQGRPLRL